MTALSFVTDTVVLISSETRYPTKHQQTRELKIARGHMMPPPQHMCNGLARPARRADEPTLELDIGTYNGTDNGT